MAASRDSMRGGRNERADALPAGWGLKDDYWDAGCGQLYRIITIRDRAHARASAFTVVDLVSQATNREPSAAPCDGGRRSPAQDRVAGGRHLVHASDREALRLGVERLGGSPGDLHDLLQGGREGVERGPALRLRRLDHHRLGNDKREVDGRGVEAALEQPLG